jgi:sodium-independent sulfate anion transporter 11
VQSQATSFSSKAVVTLTSCIQTEMSEMCTKKFVQRRLPVIVWLPQYSFSSFGQDMLAGLTVALTLIPQSMAYADVAGLPPQVNLLLHMCFS